MPVLNKGDSNMAIMPMSYSPNTLQRRFEIIDEFEMGSSTYWIIYDRKTPFSAVVDAGPALIENDLRHRVIATLELIRVENFDGLSVKAFWQDAAALQVEGVVVQEIIQGFGLATRMYETLVVHQNITLMSDHHHYEGGKALWKHIAQKSRLLQVFVLDTNEGKFYPYDGTKIRYDGTCIPESKIWSVHPDESLQGIILIAEAREKVSALSVPVI
ncbi:hypothetical protein VH86_14470 [Pantoea sp. BL1]|uniref:hypothetical protein n=1 Tax=Pantoea sp. BL1 TaxID=1628190 RepID=UPI0005F7AFC4|nr:hypothetical protein [Pantoea sp. BL1]KJV47788.1 hypothetical protein VH86_14470 [Pantoea sp. BL1]